MTALFLLPIIILMACHENDHHKANTFRQTSTKSVLADSPILPNEVSKSLVKIDDSIAQANRVADRKDSIQLAVILQEALTFAYQNKDHPFRHRFISNLVGRDTAQEVTVNLRYGNLFNTDCYHLIISREYLYGQVDVYLLKEGHFEHLISNDGGMQYLENKCRDVNGDGSRDFISHWYPVSGCCRRNVFQVYLYRPLTQGFTAQYEFINPTFYPKERLIRGVEYGHPGEVGLYKYKWNGLHIDTLEYIYPLQSKSGPYVRTLHATYRPDKSEGIILHSIPSEYRRIDDYDWFIMKE